MEGDWTHRNPWAPIPPATFMEDFFQTMQILGRKKEIKFNPSAIGYEDVSTSLYEEFKQNKNLSWELSEFEEVQKCTLKSTYPLGYAFLLTKFYDGSHHTSLSFVGHTSL